MSSAAKEFEDFARDCVRLAERADTPELREKLLNLAREWMRAVMDDGMRTPTARHRTVDPWSPLCGVTGEVRRLAPLACIVTK
jgi:hypothetical protein